MKTEAELKEMMGHLEFFIDRDEEGLFEDMLSDWGRGFMAGIRHALKKSEGSQDGD